MPEEKGMQTCSSVVDWNNSQTKTNNAAQWGPDRALPSGTNPRRRNSSNSRQLADQRSHFLAGCTVTYRPHNGASSSVADCRGKIKHCRLLNKRAAKFNHLIWAPMEDQVLQTVVLVEVGGSDCE
jgi:hypothetical protein